jgi:hypothetical protein
MDAADALRIPEHAALIKVIIYFAKRNDLAGLRG